jgi:hypothetical protein
MPIHCLPNRSTSLNTDPSNCRSRGRQKCFGQSSTLELGKSSQTDNPSLLIFYMSCTRVYKRAILNCISHLMYIPGCDSLHIVKSLSLFTLIYYKQQLYNSSQWVGLQKSYNIIRSNTTTNFRQMWFTLQCKQLDTICIQVLIFSQH